MPIKSVWKAARDAIENPSDRVVLIALFTSLFCLHYLVRLFVPDPAPFAAPFPTAELVGFAAIASVLWSLGADRVLHPWDYPVIMIAAIATIHPWRHVGALALTAVGLLFIPRRDRRLASLGQLCIGLGCVGVWGQMAQASIEARLLPIETALAYFPLSFSGSFSLVGNAILGPSGHSILVEGGCSAFSNILKTSFIWLSFMKIQRLEFRPPYLRILAASLLAVFLLNALRLDLCAWSRDYFIFWHDGHGADIISWALLTVALGLFYIGLYDERRGQAA